MKLLKSFIKRHHASFRWGALFSGIVLCLNLSIASPVHAIPTTYTLPGGLFSGSFTLDQSFSPGSFTFWNITPLFGPTYITGAYDVNTTSGTLSQLVTSASLPKLSLQFDSSTLTFSISSQFTSGQNTFKLEQSGQVPEPAAAVLLAIGLLVLAGSRWLPVRRERQQLR
jgi:hypothetical protein